MTSTKPTATFLFLDLETTGLDPEQDQILECAAVVCGPDLEPVGCSYQIVLALSPAGAARLAANDYVRNMHTVNGLLDECARSPNGITSMVADLLALVDAFEWTDDGKPILAGSTIQFDRSFMLPPVLERLHYRQLDTRSAALLARSVGVEIPKGEAHRAMPDVLESIATAQTIAAMIKAGA